MGTIKTHLLDDRLHGWANLGFWGESVGSNNKGGRDHDSFPFSLEACPKSYIEAASDLARIHGIRGGLGPQVRLLDIAVGRGASLNLWAQDFQVKSADMIEPSADSLAVLKNKKLTGSPGFEGEIFSAPLESYLGSNTRALKVPEKNHYDCILCIDSAYHIHSSEVFLMFVSRYLKPGGIAVWSNFVWQAPFKKPPFWLGLLGIRQEALVHLNTLPHLASTIGLYWITPWFLNEAVMHGFAKFVEKRRRTLRVLSRLSSSWLAIEGTALALENLNHPPKKAKRDGLGENSTAVFQDLENPFKGMGYGVFAVRKSH